MYYEINPIKFDSIEINCQKIYDLIISCEMEYEDNVFFKNNIYGLLDSILFSLYEVNEVEIFQDMLDLIFRFKRKNRELVRVIKLMEDNGLKCSKNLHCICNEMKKFNEIILIRNKI